MCPKRIKLSDEQIEQLKEDVIPDGMTYQQCSYYCRTYLSKSFRPVKSKYQNPHVEEFYNLHRSGLSYAEIAKRVGLSRQRVAVIVSKHSPKD